MEEGRKEERKEGKKEGIVVVVGWYFLLFNASGSGDNGGDSGSAMDGGDGGSIMKVMAIGSDDGVGDGDR